MNDKIESCTFCSEFENRAINNYLLILAPEIEHRKIFETSNFVVIPGIGPLVDGYLLIIPKTHYLSFGHLEGDLILEYEELKTKITQIVFEEYEILPSYFEHGPVSESKRGGCCVDHAHMHLMPTSLDLLPELKQNFSGKRVHSLVDLRQQITKNTPYLYYEKVSSDEKYVFDAPNVESQYLRKLFAQKMGVPEKWDWLLFPDIEKMKTALYKMRTYKLEEK